MAVLTSRGVAVLCVLVIMGVGGSWSSGATTTMVTAEAPLPDCGPVVIQLQGCLQFVTGKSAAPDDDCCSNVLDVHHSNPACLCVLAENDTTTNLIPNYRVDLAGQLVSLCKIQGASILECPALLGNGNATAPATSPGASAPSTPSPGGAHSLMTSANLREFIFTYMGIILASSLAIWYSKY